MEKSELEKKISVVFSDVFAQHAGGETLPVMEASTILLETGLDSLGFAILVTQLEEEVGFDPFSLSAEAYYPQTFGEFVTFYYDNQPK